MFHEVRSCAAPGMLSNVALHVAAGNTCARLSGVSSQFNEMWRAIRAAAKLARHNRTGAHAAELMARLLAAQTFDQGMHHRIHGGGVIDQAWTHWARRRRSRYRLRPLRGRCARRKRHGPALVPPRYTRLILRSILRPIFRPATTPTDEQKCWHGDAGEWSSPMAGLAPPPKCANLRMKVLSRGRSVDTKGRFIDFYGAPPKVAPLVAYGAF